MNTKITLRIILIIFCILAVNSLVYAADRKEGGYYGTEDRHRKYVRNFLKHFNYEQYYRSSYSQFTNNNDNYVDAMNLVYFSGHGNGHWRIQTAGTSGDGVVDFRSAGYSSNKGYGDKNLEFIVFHACDVIPGPRDVSDWWTPWVKNGGIFDGLHQALGFRSSCYGLSGPAIASYFGYRMKKDGTDKPSINIVYGGSAGQYQYRVWKTWLNAIRYKGMHFLSWNEYGSAVMYPGAENDTYSNVSPDPPENHASLKIWYQY